MKKGFVFMMSLVLICSFIACGTHDDKSSGDGEISNSIEQQQISSDITESLPEESEEQVGNETQPVIDPKFEELVTSLGLPGLGLPEGFVYEKAFMATFAGVNLKNAYGISSDEHRAIVTSIWELCKSLSEEGNYAITTADGVCTITENYESLTDLVAEFETEELSNYSLTWHYSYEEMVVQIRVMGSETMVSVYTSNAGTLAK